MHRRVRAYLALENGAVFAGYAIGAVEQEAAGEVVFNTAMSGYEEILTDPSYRGQIVTFTYPHIGNYGITLEDGESERVQVEGIVVHECSPVYSNWRAKLSLQEYLQREGVVGIEGVDTRMLVRMIREYGALRGVISATASPEELVERARSLPPMEGQDLTDRVGCRAPYWWTDEGLETGALIAVMDFGVKRNILRNLARRGCRVRVFPARVELHELLACAPDGIVLSNGPGDPAAITYALPLVRELVARGYPILGICLGHQLLGLALGARTYKLKFGHHGANHPVLNLHTGVVEITSQNHGFAVDPDTLPPELEVTHINLNDGTLEGMQHRSLPVMSVQYHPEAAPGPHDATYIFNEFLRLVRVARAEVA
jgi:carbamoyl-phosphate synthase small subunit